MSRRTTAPASVTRSTSAYAASRAAARSGAGGRRAQHPAAGGDQLAARRARRAGVDEAGAVGTGDHVTGTGGLRVAGRRDDHRHRRTRRASAAAAAAASVPVAAARSSPASGVSSRASTTCVSGSPKRALNSITFGPAAGERQPHVEQPGERRAAPAHLGQGRLARPATSRPATSDGRRPRQRRVRAHPAGVGPGVAVADPLEVLRRQQRHGGLAVGDHEQRDLGPVEVLLDRRPGRSPRRAPARPPGRR